MSESNISDNKTDEIRTRDDKGLFVNCPGPGRPPGMKNKFTMLKEALVDVFHEENGKEKFKALFNGDNKDLKFALQQMITVLPREKEPTTNISNSNIMINIIKDHNPVDE